VKPQRRPDPASLVARIAALDEQGSLDAVRARVAAGDDALAIIADCQRGMQSVGEDYQSGKYFISGLIMAGEIFREAMEILEPLLPAPVDAADGRDAGAGTGTGSDSGAGSAAGGRAGSADSGGRSAAGTVLVCTVRGDIHDIGKSILVTLLRSYGLTVHDLGVDVPPAEVARRVVELAPDVVGLSGLLTAAHASMRETVAELRRATPRPGATPTIIIGGGAVDEQVREWSGADLWAADAVRGVELIRRHANDRPHPTSPAE
jgi:methylmalonyl-CoA mutase cobalamin-binding domain/chain